MFPNIVEEEQKEQGLKRIRENSPVSPTPDKSLLVGVDDSTMPAVTSTGEEDGDERNSSSRRGSSVTIPAITTPTIKSPKSPGKSGNLLTIPGGAGVKDALDTSQSSETLTLTDSNSCHSSPSSGASQTLSTSTHTLVGSIGGGSSAGVHDPASNIGDDSGSASPKHQNRYATLLSLENIIYGMGGVLQMRTLSARLILLAPVRGELS